MIHWIYPWGIPLEPDWVMMTRSIYLRGFPLALDDEMTHSICPTKTLLEMDGAITQWLPRNLDFPWEILN